MPTLYLIRGLPGSGKTTRAKEMLKRGIVDVHVEADQFFEQNEDGEYKFVAANIGDAHAWCRAAAAEALDDGKDVVVANTFTEFWEMADYFYFAREKSVRVEVIEMQGTWENIHGVPEKSLQRMRERWQEYKRG